MIDDEIGLLRRMIKWVIIGWRIYHKRKATRMRTEPLQITPGRVEPRGDFPQHGQRPPRPPLTAEQARALAYWRLRLWRARHAMHGRGEHHGIRD